MQEALKQANKKINLMSNITRHDISQSGKRAFGIYRTDLEMLLWT